MHEEEDIELRRFRVTSEVNLREDGDAIIINGQVLKKPVSA